jgi:nucleotide-binding universal stress UspA family protein
MKILIAVDTSDAAHEAVLVTKRLFPDDEHIVLGAASVSPFALADPIGGGVFAMGLTEQMFVNAENEADRAISEACKVLEEDATANMVIGSAGSAICGEAAELGVDVVVVGRRSKTWMSRLFDPSVSDYVIKHSPCPVLVVREADDN